MERYRLGSGGIAAIVEDESTRERYCVEFRDYYQGPSLDNFFGLLKERFSGKSEHLERLITEGDYVALSVSYSRGPLRQAYAIHSVSSPQSYRNPGRVTYLPQNHGAYRG